MYQAESEYSVLPVLASGFCHIALVVGALLLPPVVRPPEVIEVQYIGSTSSPREGAPASERDLPLSEGVSTASVRNSAVAETVTSLQPVGLPDRSSPTKLSQLKSAQKRQFNVKSKKPSRSTRSAALQQVKEPAPKIKNPPTYAEAFGDPLLDVDEGLTAISELAENTKNKSKAKTSEKGSPKKVSELAKKTDLLHRPQDLGAHSVDTKKNLPEDAPPLLAEDSEAAKPLVLPPKDKWLALSDSDSQDEYESLNESASPKKKSVDFSERTPEKTIPQKWLENQESQNKYIRQDPGLARTHQAPAFASDENRRWPQSKQESADSLVGAQIEGAHRAALSARTDRVDGSRSGGTGGVQGQGGSGERRSSGLVHLEDLRQMPGNRLPLYEVEERLRGDQGTAIIHAYIKSNGRPEAIKLVASTGFSNLDEKSLAAIKTWRFYPGREVWVEIPISWSLSGGAESAPSRLRR